jgi:predicted RND superfamily exporter protein
VRPFRELAFFMSVGLLIDAFLVRTLLVPSLIALVGPVSGWPGGQLRRRARLAPPAAAPPAVAPAHDGHPAKLAQSVVIIGVVVGALAGLTSRRRGR